jgi:hypothetical protein
MLGTLAQAFRLRFSGFTARSPNISTAKCSYFNADLAEVHRAAQSFYDGPGDEISPFEHTIAWGSEA